MLGVEFEIVSADADESSTITDPALLVQELALRKGRAVRELLLREGRFDNDTLIIAADTVVAAEGEILGKPRNDADAARMLQMLAGNTHHVISGVALLQGTREIADFDKTAVRFAPMSEEEIAAYVQSGEPRDKAGAYAVQGLASVYVEGLSGDYFNVVGLPVHKLDMLTRKFVGRSLLQLSQ